MPPPPNGGADRIGIRISPLGPFNGLDNGEDQEEAALYLIGPNAESGATDMTSFICRYCEPGRKPKM